MSAVRITVACAAFLIVFGVAANAAPHHRHRVCRVVHHHRVCRWV
jgi:hypothetical protein